MATEIEISTEPSDTPEDTPETPTMSEDVRKMLCDKAIMICKKLKASPEAIDLLTRDFSGEKPAAPEAPKEDTPKGSVANDDETLNLLRQLSN